MTRRKAPPLEWAELAGRLTAYLSELPDEDAARIVAGMTPAARTRVRDHLRLHPDALVSGASDAPRSVQALIASLAGSGIVGVRAPACLRCGRIRPLRRAVPGGRVCLRRYSCQPQQRRSLLGVRRHPAPAVSPAVRTLPARSGLRLQVVLGVRQAHTP